MRVGYPGRNLTLDLPAPPPLRPETYSPGRPTAAASANLDAIAATLSWNLAHGIIMLAAQPLHHPPSRRTRSLMSIGHPRFAGQVAVIDCFVATHDTHPDAVLDREAGGNDERLFSLADKLVIHARAGVPHVFGTFHHSLFNAGGKCAMRWTSSRQSGAAMARR